MELIPTNSSSAREQGDTEVPFIPSYSAGGRGGSGRGRGWPCPPALGAIPPAIRSCLSAQNSPFCERIFPSGRWESPVTVLQKETKKKKKIENSRKMT